MIFEGHVFYPIGSLSTSVPVLAVGGLAKVYLAPGWRLGWIIVYDKKNLMKEVTCQFWNKFGIEESQLSFFFFSLE